MELTDKLLDETLVAEVAEKLREVMDLAKLIPHSERLQGLIAVEITEAKIEYRTRARASNPS